MNSEKTNNGEFISSYECNAETASSEFALSKREYFQITGRKQRNDVIAYQIRQSFKPDEVTPEEANAIGYEFAKRFTKGNHAFIVCTHIDKQHIHNHIIWNSTSLDCTRKFRNFWGSTKTVMKLSDLICAEHHLSIIENPKAHGKSYINWLGDKRNKSNRDYLIEAMNKAFEKEPKSLDEFFSLLKEDGYAVVLGKHMAFSHPRQKKNIRCRSLGEGYTEKDIKAAVLGNRAFSSSGKQKHFEKTTLLSEIEKKIKSGKGFAYENWAKKFSSKQIARSLLFLKEHNFDNYEDFIKGLNEKEGRYKELSEEQKLLQKRISEIVILKKHIINYSKTKDVYAEYRKSGYSKKYYAEHEADIIIHKAAKKAFDESGLNKLPSIKELNAEYAKLLQTKKACYGKYSVLRKEVREMRLHKQNYEFILGIQKDENEKTEHSARIEK